MSALPPKADNKGCTLRNAYLSAEFRRTKFCSAGSWKAKVLMPKVSAKSCELLNFNCRYFPPLWLVRYTNQLWLLRHVQIPFPIFGVNYFVRDVAQVQRLFCAGGFKNFAKRSAIGFWILFQVVGNFFCIVQQSHQRSKFNACQDRSFCPNSVNRFA